MSEQQRDDAPRARKTSVWLSREQDAELRELAKRGIGLADVVRAGLETFRARPPGKAVVITLLPDYTYTLAPVKDAAPPSQPPEPPAGSAPAPRTTAAESFIQQLGGQP
jgi:hypothetical protein